MNGFIDLGPDPFEDGPRPPLALEILCGFIIGASIGAVLMMGFSCVRAGRLRAAHQPPAELVEEAGIIQAANGL